MHSQLLYVTAHHFTENDSVKEVSQEQLLLIAFQD